MTTVVELYPGSICKSYRLTLLRTLWASFSPTGLTWGDVTQAESAWKGSNSPVIYLGGRAFPAEVVVPCLSGLREFVSTRLPEGAKLRADWLLFPAHPRAPLTPLSAGALADLRGSDQASVLSDWQLELSDMAYRWAILSRRCSKAQAYTLWRAQIRQFAHDPNPVEGLPVQVVEEFAALRDGRSDSANPRLLNASPPLPPHLLTPEIVQGWETRVRGCAVRYLDGLLDAWLLSLPDDTGRQICSWWAQTYGIPFPPKAFDRYVLGRKKRRGGKAKTVRTVQAETPAPAEPTPTPSAQPTAPAEPRHAWSPLNVREHWDVYNHHGKTAPMVEMVWEARQPEGFTPPNYIPLSAALRPPLPGPSLLTDSRALLDQFVLWRGYTFWPHRRPELDPTVFRGDELKKRVEGDPLPSGPLFALLSAFHPFFEDVHPNRAEEIAEVILGMRVNQIRFFTRDTGIAVVQAGDAYRYLRWGWQTEEDKDLDRDPPSLLPLSRYMHWYTAGWPSFSGLISDNAPLLWKFDTTLPMTADKGERGWPGYSPNTFRKFGDAQDPMNHFTVEEVLPSFKRVWAHLTRNLNRTRRGAK